MTARDGDRGLDLAAITHAASREAGGVPPGLLGDYPVSYTHLTLPTILLV